MVSMVSSDSVFVKNEAADTHAQAETPAAHSIPVSESANQEPNETVEPEQKEAGDEVTSEQPGGDAVEGESANQEPHEMAEPEQKEGAGDEVVSEQTDGATVEENAARPPSSVSRKEIDECNSMSQLPKVIVKKSINAAVNRLSLHKDDEVETSGANEEQSETGPQEDQFNEPLLQEAEGEYMKGSQPAVPHEGQTIDAEEVNDTNGGVVTTELQKYVTTESQEVETAEAPATTTTQSEEGCTTQKVHVSSSATNTAANEDSISGQEPPVVEGNGAMVEENRPEDEGVIEQEASASDGNVAENNKDDQAGDVRTAEPTEADEKNDGEEADGTGGSSKTPEEIVPSGSSDESATPSDVQETQNEQQQEDNA